MGAKKVKAKKKAGTSSNGSDQQLVLALPGTITPMALILNPRLEYRPWAYVGIQLRRVKEFIQFALGDWLNHGETHYGETYAQAAGETGLPEDTLMILKSVAARVAPENRIQDLTWSHHREVAKFPPDEQARWLAKALEQHWSVRDLKAALEDAGERKGKRREDGEDREEEQGPPTGEACECCGSSPAPMRICARCAVVPATAIETIGIKGALDLMKSRPSKPQLAMLKWAFEQVSRPDTFETDQAEAEWEARFEALQKVATKAA